MVVWGAPLVLVFALWARWLLGPDAPLAMVFWLMLAAMMAGTVAWPRLASDYTLRLVLATALGCTGAAHFAAFRPDDSAHLIVDLVLLVLAAAIAVCARHVASPAWTASRGPTE
jgi:hypothetical protein